MIILSLTAMKFFDRNKNRIHGDSISITADLIRSNRFEVQPISVLGCGKLRKLRIKNVTINTRKNATFHFHHRIGGGFSLDEYGLQKLIEKRFIRHNGMFIRCIPQ